QARALVGNRLPCTHRAFFLLARRAGLLGIGPEAGLPAPYSLTQKNLPFAPTDGKHLLCAREQRHIRTARIPVVMKMSPVPRRGDGRAWSSLFVTHRPVDRLPAAEQVK